MATTQDSIRAIVDNFVQQLETAWRAEALRVLSSLSSGGIVAQTKASAPKGKPGRKPGRKPAAAKAAAPKAAKAAKAAKAPKAKKAAKAASSAGKKGRRGKEEIEALANKIHAHVKANPGSGAEKIKQALGIKGKYEWLAPVALLLESKRLVSAGQKRSTTYTAK